MSSLRVTEHLKAIARELAADTSATLPAIRSILRRTALDPRPIAGTTFLHTEHHRVRGTWIIPENANFGRRIVYCHGCGFIAGDIDLYGGFLSRLAAAANACILFVDYRLAPENVFPAAHEDCLHAFLWALDHGPDQKSSPAVCCLAGDSCGAGLAINTALKAARADRPAAGVLVFSPFVDLTVSGHSSTTNNGKDPMVTAASATACAPLYAPAINPQDPRLSPLFDDLSLLPPLHIQASTSDPLLDDAIRLADKAGKSNIQVSLHLWTDFPHCWYLFPDELPDVASGIKLAGAFVRTGQ